MTDTEVDDFAKTDDIPSSFNLPAFFRKTFICGALFVAGASSNNIQTYTTYDPVSNTETVHTKGAGKMTVALIAAAIAAMSPEQRHKVYGWGKSVIYPEKGGR